jgi:hypothetical protein
LVSSDADPTVRLEAMKDAVLKVWGSQDETKTARLSKCLSLIFYSLAVHRLSLLDAYKFSHVSMKEDAEQLIAELPDFAMRQEWSEFHQYPDRQFMEYMESTNSRFLPFVTSPAVSRMVGQTENVIDFQKCMEERHIVLVNLATQGRSTRKNSQAIGAMIFADLFISAQARSIGEAKDNPFYCYVDECANYLTDDIANSLDETRKFGLHYILAHQRMEQLRQHGENLADAVIDGAQTKVVFRVNREQTAEELARHLFGLEFDLQTRMKRLTMPVTVGHEIEWFKSESTSTTSIDELVRSDGGSAGMGASVFEPDEGDAAGKTTSESESESWSETRRQTENESNTEGRSEGLRPIIEERGVPYTLEALVLEGVQEIRGLPDREAIIHFPGAKVPFRVRTTDLDTPLALPVQRERALRMFAQKSRYTTLTADVLAQIDARREEALDLIDLDEDDEGEFRFGG